MNNSMNISGCGSIPAGEYEEITVSGSGKLSGLVKCTSFSSAGFSSGEHIECAEKVKNSGHLKFSGNVKAKNLSTVGDFLCGGDVNVSEEISAAGAFDVKGGVTANKLSVSGLAKIGADVETEKISINGSLKCPGLVNAESVDIRFDGKVEIGSLGGSKVVISLNKVKKFFKRLPLLSSAMRNAKIATAIEADEIEIDNVSCPRISGRNVVIGDGCVIDLVLYSESIEISPNAKVEKSEKF